jgi:hypothetical protein
VSVASHESAVSLLGHTESLLAIFSAHVVILGLLDHLPVVNALLVLGRVRLVKLVDNDISAKVLVALTELSSDLRFATNLFNSVFTSQR